MKLKNKRTGEIVEPYLEWCSNSDKPHSLAELNEDWEDYEEPKWYWYIDDAGVLQIDQVLSSEINMRKAIGNYFETEGEAEEAVEKLKAYKRLKDAGFKLKGWYMPKNVLNIEIDGGFSDDVSLCDIMDGLDIIFGGEG